MIRHYSNTAVAVALTADVNGTVGSLQVSSTASFPDAPFTIGIERGTPNEEICLVTAVPDGVTLTVDRAFDDTTGKPHSADSPVEHCVIALDYREANDHANDAAMHQAAPTGVVLPWFGAAASVPAGWLICDGAAVSRATYSDLHDLLKDARGADSYPFGAGDGATTFNVPDLRGRTLLGNDNMGGSSANRVVNAQADLVGGVAGAETVTLTTAQMPAHTHIQNPHTHVQNPHNHLPTGTIFDPWVATLGGDQGMDPAQGGGIQYAGTTSNTTATNQNTTAVNQNAGGGQAHDNMPPYMAVHMIIKA